VPGPNPKYEIWLLDFDRCSTLEGKGDVEAYIAMVLARNDLTIPKARETDEGYRSFKTGYIRAGERFGSNAKESCHRVLRILEEQIMEREKRILDRSSVRGRRGVRPRGSDSPNWRQKA